MQQADGRIRRTRRRYDTPGHVHELTWSCYRKMPLLSRDRTRAWLREALERARTTHLFALYAYVIMPEHAHVLLRPADESRIAAILKSIKQSVARRAVAWLVENQPRFLDRLRVTRPSGRVEFRFWQQGGGYDRNIVEPGTLTATIEYIHANPVRRGLVAGQTDWEWSSARWYAGRREDGLEMDDVSGLLG